MPTALKPYIILIDDDVKDDQPLVGYLRKEYGDKNVFLFQQPNEGVKFIEENLSKRMIVLLDIMFDGKAVGFDIFNQIVDKSSLVCFIVMTGSIERTERADLVNLINRHAWYLVARDKPAKEILGFIRRAEEHLAVRIDGALEEWVLRHSPTELQKPFFKTRDGKSYTLTDILTSIRKGDDDGVAQRMVANILSVAIELLAQDESRIGN